MERESGIMRERGIQNILYRHLKKLGHTMITPNVKYMFSWYENDLISVTKPALSMSLR